MLRAFAGLIGALGSACARTLIVSPPPQPQPAPAALTVVVRDSLSSLALHGVTVVLRDNVGVARRTKTDSTGRVHFDSLPQGTYRMVAEARMFDSTSVAFVAAPGVHASRALLMRGRVRQAELGMMRQVQMDSLNAAKARWRAQPSKTYRITMQLDCFCMGRGFAGVVTAEELFDTIEGVLRDPHWQMRSVIYDPVTGLPNSYYLDTTADITDMHSAVTISAVKIPPAGL
jgi:hypothetical protein